MTKVQRERKEEEGESECKAEGAWEGGDWAEQEGGGNLYFP